MISNRKGWNFLAIKNICIIKRNKIKTVSEFYDFNNLHLFGTKKTSISKKSMAKTAFLGVVIPSKDTDILEFNQYQISDKYHLLFM